jgi:hypothetical protein
MGGCDGVTKFWSKLYSTCPSKKIELNLGNIHENIACGKLQLSKDTKYLNCRGINNVFVLCVAMSVLGLLSCIANI